MATWPHRTRKPSFPEPEINGIQDKWKPYPSLKQRRGGNVRFGSIPFTKETAQRWALRIQSLMAADPEGRLASYWASRVGLDCAEADQVLGELAEMDE